MGAIAALSVAEAAEEESLPVAAELAEPPEVDEAVLELTPEVCDRASAVALRVPQLSFSWQTACPSASFGLLAIH